MPTIVIVTSLSLWRHSQPGRRAARTGYLLWRHSRYDDIGATPTVTDVRANKRMNIRTSYRIKYRQTLWTCAQTSLTTPLRSEHYAMLMLWQDAKTSHERVHDQTANRRQPPSPARSSRLHSLFKSWMECCVLPSLRSLNYRLPRRLPQTQVRRHPRVIT